MAQLNFNIEPIGNYAQAKNGIAGVGTGPKGVNGAPSCYFRVPPGEEGLGVFSSASCAWAGKVQSGVYFQSTGNCSVQFTLAPPELATSDVSELQDTVKWSDPVDLSDGAIYKADPGFTAFKLVSTGAPGGVVTAYGI